MNTKTIAFLVALALGAQQTPTLSDYKRDLEQKARELLEMVQQLPVPAPEPEPVRVPSGGDLQAALDAGGEIELEAGATYTAPRYIARKSGTILRGNGASLVATSGPALEVLPDVDDVHAYDLEGASPYSSVFLCGSNDPAKQSAVEQEPQRIVFTRLKVPSHRNKRGFEANCQLTLIDSEVRDTYIAGQDSQGVAVLNTCGPVVVRGGTYEAASENILMGGADPVMPCLTRGTLIEHVRLTKPEAWRAAGVRVKNLLEIKKGIGVIVRDSYLSTNWKDQQEGAAFVITPKNGYAIDDVLIENVTVENVAMGIHFLGLDYNSVTPAATRNVRIVNSRFAISKAAWGGRGILALYVGGMRDSLWENVTATFDGNAIVSADTSLTTGPQGPFVMRGSRMNTGQYAVTANGVNYGGPTPAAYAGRELSTIFEGNTFIAAPSQFKTLYPNNTFVAQ